jgi:hypothetical protein
MSGADPAGARGLPQLPQKVSLLSSTGVPQFAQ